MRFQLTLRLVNIMKNIQKELITWASTIYIHIHYYIKHIKITNQFHSKSFNFFL